MKRVIATMLVLSSTLHAGEFPWSNTAPSEIIRQSVLPTQVLDEEPCNWQPALTPIVTNLVKNCKTARDAVLTISTQLSKVTGVYYSQARSKHNMNALEALEEKKVSCTGQSILLICALRSIGIPARAVGIRTWNHINGNHTWAEAWFDGEWHMIEFNESDFNTGWVMEYIGMLNPEHPKQRILAATPAGNKNWNHGETESKPTKAEDVTNRYTQLAHQWYQINGLKQENQRLFIDISPRPNDNVPIKLVDKQQNLIATGVLPSIRDDIRFMTRLQLPRKGSYNLFVNNKFHCSITATALPAQVLIIENQSVSH